MPDDGMGRDDCTRCGAPAWWQEPTWQPLADDEPGFEGICRECGAITDEAGKFYGP